ncbi:MAG: hypothetical protein OEM62_06085 [Acidobacteriota bacterium]|nr:hypothetical protein [Acidobacteriota bacterium]
MVILAYYYWQASRHELKAFFGASVYGRCAVLVGFIAFVVTGLAPPILVLFGAIDAAAAGWTAASLRADSHGRRVSVMKIGFSDEGEESRRLFAISHQIAAALSAGNRS